MELQDALAQYESQLQADGRSRHTIAQYRRHIRPLGSWLGETGQGTDTETVTHQVLAGFLGSPAATARPDGDPKTATSVNALRSSLRTFWAYLHAAGLLSENPARLVRQARCAPPPPRTLSEAEQERLLTGLGEGVGEEARRDHALFHLMLGAGLRVWAAIGLDVADLDFELEQANVRRDKGGRPAAVFLPPAVVEHLQRYLGARTTGPLFRGRGGRRISVRHAQRRFTMWLGRVGIERAASPHSLRHSFATALYQRTGDLHLVRRALHHRSVASTVIYAEVDDRDVQRAVAQLAV